jgi:hypothetical protein
VRSPPRNEKILVAEVKERMDSIHLNLATPTASIKERNHINRIKIDRISSHSNTDESSDDDAESDDDP